MSHAQSRVIRHERCRDFRKFQEWLAPSENFNRRGQVGRQFGLELQRFAFNRMLERQVEGVEEMAVYQGTSVSIGAIAHQRVPDVGHVHPDLMGAPRLQV